MKHPLSLWSCKALAVRLALLDQSSQSFLHHMDSLVGRRGPDYHTKNQSFVYTLSFVSLAINTEKIPAWSDVHSAYIMVPLMLLLYNF